MEPKEGQNARLGLPCYFEGGYSDWPEAETPKALLSFANLIRA